jgi:hypothetical protein
MVFAPLTGFVHLGDIAADLAAVITIPDDVAIDSGSVRLKPALAFFSVVPVSASRHAECKHEPSG